METKLYFVDNILFIIYKKRIIKLELDNIIYKGFIVDRNAFMDEFIKIRKKEKIRGNIFNDEITIIQNSFYRVSDLYYLENIFGELGYLKVKFFNLFKYWPQNDMTYIEINNSYMVINFSEPLYLDLTYYYDIPRIISYFAKFFAKNIVIFGLNKIIPNIKIKNKNLYYYDNYDTYVVDKIMELDH